MHMHYKFLLRIYLSLFVVLYSFSVAAQKTPKLVLPIGHTKSVNFAEFSPDGQLVVTASSDGTAKIWSTSSGKLLLDLKGHTDHVSAAKFSPDGTFLLTASWDNTAKIWDTRYGKLMCDLKGHTSDIYSANFSLDGKKVITASEDRITKIWDASNGKLMLDLIGHTGTVWYAEFSPDGQNVITASWDSTAKIWDANNGKLLADLNGHKGKVTSASFSPDGRLVVTSSNDSTAKIWNSGIGKLFADLRGHKDWVRSAKFSPDGKQVVTASGDKTAKIWEAGSGKLILDLQGHKNYIESAKFSPNGQKVLTVSGDSTAKIWDATNGILVADLKGHVDWVNSAEFSSDGNAVVTASDDRTARIWDTKSGKIIVSLGYHTHFIFSTKFSPDGNTVVTASDDYTAKIWDTKSGKLLKILNGHIDWINSVQYSPDGQKLVTASSDGTAKIWDTKSGKLIEDLKGHNNWVNSAEFSPDGEKVVTTSNDSTTKIWEVMSGKLLLNLENHTSSVDYAEFSLDGQKVLTFYDNVTEIWNVSSGKLHTVLKGHSMFVNSAEFSRNGQKIVTSSQDGIVNVWDARNGKLLKKLKGHSEFVKSAKFSPDGLRIITISGFQYQTVKISDAISGELIADLFVQNGSINYVEFSPDGQRIITASDGGFAKIWDVSSGKLLFNLIGHSGALNSAEFSPDGKLIVTSSVDNTSMLWNANTGELLYTFFAVDSSDYLVVDKYYRYDGTPGARKLLYFTCGTEIIELDQLKDQLWVPNLAERILNGETIEAKKLEDLDICQLTPVVEEKTKSDAQEYVFAITPQRGGLGKTVLYVNDFPIKTYRPDNLFKTSTGYLLKISRSELLSNFVSGETNQVSVRSFIANDLIGSRGELIIDSDLEKQKPPPPNLYAVMIGVSDYKGEELDLKYAAKDAKDLSAALTISAQKLLNYDGQEHVFVYDLTTSEGKYRLPEKEAIRKLLQEIGLKTKPNDMLLLFFAGHGVMAGEANKQFYFLTADASPSTAVENPSAVGISMLELMDWVKLQNVNAQKRILILDACNSGQAIKDFVKLGGNEQGYMAARSDEYGQQIKAIDKLNEQTGFSILAASASSQSAYEMGRYSQGLLTYSLLRAIKLQPDILEQGKYLDVSRWFGAAEKTVSEISKSSGQRQDPQRVASNNFNLGVVDEEVLRKIILPQEKPLFGPVNLQNADEAISSDDLELGKLLQYELTDISSRGEEGSIMFDEKLKSEEVWTLSGRYEITNNKILAKINIKQGKQTPKYRFEVNGSKDNLNELSKAIVSKAIKVVQEK